MDRSAAFLLSDVALWVVVALQAVVLIELLRAVGLLRLRIGDEAGALITSDALQRGTVAPAFVLPDLVSGRPVSLNDGSALPALLVFLSPGCASCRRLASELEGFAKEFRKDARTIIVTAADIEQTRRFVQEFDLRIPVLRDKDAAVSRAYRAERTPYGVLIGNDGRIRLQGVINDRSQLEGLLFEEGTPMSGDWKLVADGELAPAGPGAASPIPAESR